MFCNNCYNEINENEDHTSCGMCSKHIHSECAFQCIKCYKPLCDKCAMKNKYKCDQCNEADGYKMDFISSTMFESYLQCPHSFKHEFILNTIPEDQKKNKYSMTGSALHDLFERYSVIRPLGEDEKNMACSEYVEKFNEIGIEYFDDEEDQNNFLTKGLITIENWFAEENDKPVPLFTEHRMFVELHKDLPKIRVTFDRINGEIGNSGEWEVEDYKTGKVYSSDKLTNNMQLPIYAMAIREMYGDLPRKLRLIFPQHTNRAGKIQTREFDKVTNDLYVCNVKGGGVYSISLKKRLEQMIQIYSEIKKGDFKFNTTNSIFCQSFCPLGKNNMCDGLNTKWKSLKNRGY